MKNKFAKYSWDDLADYIISAEIQISKNPQSPKTKSLKKQLLIAETEKQKRVEDLFSGSKFLIEKELNLLNYLEEALEDIG